MYHELCTGLTPGVREKMRERAINQIIVCGCLLNRKCKRDMKHRQKVAWISGRDNETKQERKGKVVGSEKYLSEMQSSPSQH